MLESIPTVLAFAGFAVSLLALAVSAMLVAGTLRRSGLVRCGLYLARDASYTTGQILSCDGGFFI